MSGLAGCSPVLSLLTDTDIFAVADSQVGTAYCSRACLRQAGIHPAIQAGVACTKLKVERYVLSVVSGAIHSTNTHSRFVVRSRLLHTAAALQVVIATKTWEAFCKRTTKTFCSFKLVGLLNMHVNYALSF